MNGDHDAASEALAAAASLDDPLDALGGSVEHVDATVAEVVEGHVEQRAAVAWANEREPEKVREESAERVVQTAGLAVVAYAAAAPDDETVAERADAARRLVNRVTAAARAGAARGDGREAVVERVGEMVDALPPGEEDAGATLRDLRGDYDEWVDRVRGASGRSAGRGR